ncbi:hypothetical protein O181_074830 [Austropuccinia psidii MF-1]|uniref:Uncharacterized protein n=1 Tax=Austropuccinia psidii MF-1 TaxID=1389203 RepID=A0A9Q3FD71_9BASI|nr:hypothetical protein [Austropuccinia psidii MF-1]
MCDLTSELDWLKESSQECALLWSPLPILISGSNPSCINPANRECNLNSKSIKHMEMQPHFIKKVIGSLVIKLFTLPLLQCWPTLSPSWCAAPLAKPPISLGLRRCCPSQYKPDYYG